MSKRDKIMKPELFSLIEGELSEVPRTMGDILKTYNENNPYSRLSHITMRKYLQYLVKESRAKAVILGRTTGYLKP